MVRRVRRAFAAAASVLLTSEAASAEADLHTKLGCPPEVRPRRIAELNVTLENGECFPRSVRLMSAIVANTGPTANGNSVLGPVFMWQTVVPAANCQTLTPAVLDLSPLLAPPVVPDAFEATLASYAIIAEWAGGAKTETHRCFIPVPEPSAPTQVVSAVLGLIILSRLRSRRAQPTRERRE